MALKQIGSVLHVDVAERHIETAFLSCEKRLSFVVGCGAIYVVGIELFLCFIDACHYLKSSLR